MKTIMEIKPSDDIKVVEKIYNGLLELCDSFIGASNNDIRRSHISQRISEYLEKYSGSAICDDSNNPPDVRDDNKRIVDVKFTHDREYNLRLIVPLWN